MTFKRQNEDLLVVDENTEETVENVAK